ncbi:MAG: putative toxin-antitoxin system toxin component, PIN family [Anaerolineales bacterium]|nr:MAG: putative toxin-antitoxin system toxin component, PIN family [Anaerolineales bacterium]
MTRSVPDTNIWFASIQWHGRPRRIRTLGERRLIVLITSQAILAELTHVMRDYFGYSDDEAYMWHKRIIAHTDIVHPTRWVNAVPDDPDDNKFVECALEGKAQYVISRDQDLLRLGEYEGIRMADDVEFLDILRAEGVVRHPSQGG